MDWISAHPTFILWQPPWCPSLQFSQWNVGRSEIRHLWLWESVHWTLTLSATRPAIFYCLTGMDLTGENVKWCCSWITIEMFYEWETNFYFCKVPGFGGCWAACPSICWYRRAIRAQSLEVNIHLFHNPVTFSPNLHTCSTARIL